MFCIKQYVYSLILQVLYCLLKTFHNSDKNLLSGWQSPSLIRAADKINSPSQTAAMIKVALLVHFVLLASKLLIDIEGACSRSRVQRRSLSAEHIRPDI